MRTIVALLLAGSLLPFGLTPGPVRAASPAPLLITDAIGPGVTTSPGAFSSASVVVPAGAFVTYLATTDPRLAGQAVQIWTKTRAGAWEVATTRSVATDGTVRFSTRVLTWIGIQARFTGNADFAAASAHGRSATVTSDDSIRLTVGCDAFTSATRTSPGPISVSRSATVLVGGTLVVTLCSNGSTGFNWDPPVYDHAHLRLISHTSAGPHVVMPGAAGTETFSFSVLGAGSTSVRFTYSQPWSGGTKATWTVSLGVRTFAAPGGPVAVTCDEFAAAADSSGRSFVARPVSARIGSEIVVTLCSNGSTGFTWETPVYDHAALRLVRVASTPPGTGLVGAAGTQTWTFRALTPGSHRVLFAYSRPWAGGEKGLWRLALTTIVRT
jgi:inhibitor of cysteine peptidase